MFLNTVHVQLLQREWVLQDFLAVKLEVLAGKRNQKTAECDLGIWQLSSRVWWGELHRGTLPVALDKHLMVIHSAFALDFYQFLITRLSPQMAPSGCCNTTWMQRTDQEKRSIFTRFTSALNLREQWMLWGASTFFVGILSFMNSASRHRTFQGAWIFKKPIPGILPWNTKHKKVWILFTKRTHSRNTGQLKKI